MTLQKARQKMTDLGNRIADTYTLGYQAGRAEERERCAKIAEGRARIWRANREALSASKATEAEAIAAEIRSTK